MPALLELSDLRISFATPHGSARAVRGVDLSLETGETLAIVGESGSGKTALALAIPGLHDPRAGDQDGAIKLDGTAISTISQSRLRLIRGSQVAMVFQDPMLSLNPLMRTGDQVGEALKANGMADPAARKSRVLELYRQVGIPSPEIRMRQYPHEFSGGMLQRVMIMIAIARGPRLLIADEPTTALDVTVQAQILALIDRLKAELGLSVLLITHDLGVVARHAGRVAVMYAGRVVETGPVRAVLAGPLHPYTRALLACIPRPGSHGRDLPSIPGSPPSVFALDAGCAFAPRCPHSQAACLDGLPALESASDRHQVACLRFRQLSGVVS